MAQKLKKNTIKKKRFRKGNSKRKKKRGSIIDKPVKNERTIEMVYLINNVLEEDDGSDRHEEDIENKNKKQDKLKAKQK